ncbi:DUF4181 domain-containing protein [Niallia sp. JL1B1071]|uniref:DUF4181 domain-containing protein n=1 Tax=Niallia tiangongensis TaxID=3237105 RepID=UPI0037DDD0F6
MVFTISKDFIFLLSFLLLLFGTEGYLRKKLGFPNKKEKKVHSLQKWLDMIVVPIAIILLFILDGPIVSMCILICHSLFQSYVEWRYNKRSKEFIIYLATGLILFVMTIIGILLGYSHYQ